MDRHENLGFFITTINGFWKFHVVAPSAEHLAGVLMPHEVAILGPDFTPRDRARSDVGDVLGMGQKVPMTHTLDQFLRYF